MKSLKEYFSRIGKSRGFGIQSPWAFRFVTEVVGERLPYYAYEDIDREYKKHGERKFQKLLLRVRNSVYPDRVVVVDDINMLTDEALNAVVAECGRKGAIIVRSIMSNNDNRQKWETLKSNEKIGITFDLYDFAICFVDREIYKQHYKLNF